MVVLHSQLKHISLLSILLIFKLFLSHQELFFFCVKFASLHFEFSFCFTHLLLIPFNSFFVFFNKFHFREEFFVFFFELKPFVFQLGFNEVLIFFFLLKEFLKFDVVESLVLYLSFLSALVFKLFENKLLFFFYLLRKYGQLLVLFYVSSFNLLKFRLLEKKVVFAN